MLGVKLSQPVPTHSPVSRYMVKGTCLMIENLIGIVVCGIWAFIGYMVGLDEGMKRR